MRAKGLCYKCKQPFHPMYEYPNKSIRAIIVGEYEEAVSNEISEVAEMESSEFNGIQLHKYHFLNMELPFYSVGGIFLSKTMKLRGLVQQKGITVMIDSGASHNFISDRLVLQLQKLIDHTPIFGVRLGDGHRVQFSGVCRNLAITM